MKKFMIAPEDGVRIGDQYDFSPLMGDLLERMVEGTQIQFMPGDYHFWPEKAKKRTLFISNTDSAEYPEKNIAMLLKEKKGASIRGEQSTLFFHGNLVALSIIDCEDIQIDGLTMTYVCPPLIDTRVASYANFEGRGKAEIAVPNGYCCDVQAGAAYWAGEKSPYTGKAYWQGKNGLDLTQHRRGDVVKRIEDRLFEDVANVQWVDGKLNIEYTTEKDIREGDGFQIRLTRRDASGIFLSCSKNITFSQVDIGFLYSMGVVSQFCDHISFSGVRFKAIGEDRQSSSAADSLHFSSCGGKIDIRDCEFSNSHDDSINIHGTYLKLESLDGNKIMVRYCHPQTQGFLPFFPGDALQFVDAQSLLPVGQKQIVSDAKFLESADHAWIEITLEEKSDVLFSENIVVYNKSYQADIVIENNEFRSIPTRAILVSSAGKVEIRKNRFSAIEMAAIYISADANEWYESGAAKDVLIEGNEFTRCQREIVWIDPRNAIYSKEKVHSNITIRKNHIDALYSPVISVKSSADVRIVENKVKLPKGKTGEKDLLKNCDSEVLCLENTFYEK